MTAWGVRDLTVRRGTRTALDGVTLDVVPGEVVAVVGGDGAGKTTLLRTLVGAITPVSGRVAAPALREIGFMPTTSGTWRELSVQENVAFVGGAYGLRGALLAERSERLLAATGLAGVRRRAAGDLSGGMRQKLGFVLAMLHEPALLVLDEPSTGVDPVSRVDLWRLVSSAAVAGTAVVMATTYLDEAERASGVLVLDRGRVLASGPPDEVVAGAPGVVRSVPAATVPAHAWRRGAQVREWFADPSGAPGEAVTPDLEDAVIAAALAKEALSAR
ncbi:ABC transporter ATP-binding protein [Cellulomonas composti]|uniref:ABC transporter ATP-binding protein n=1 Tax=Cellulomonas composti TaxID=266130 RepID=A0A511J6V3_9CELL|nr:ABC transporter ATP-binding protein [Cellulomonas composti]GEL93730.1 ABC transporter ATP-binding protein [Cellulomonas composti]